VDGFLPGFPSNGIPVGLLQDGIQDIRNAATLLEGDAPQDIVVFGLHVGGFSLGLRHESIVNVLMILV
jgi:hypothetical protein